MEKGVVFLVILVGVGIVLFVSVRSNANPLSLVVATAPSTTSMSTDTPTGGQPMLPTTTVRIGDTRVVAELATTKEAQRLGLSGRVTLTPGAAMLFVFSPPTQTGFWMKDMQFSLDIIYASPDGTIINIYPSISPATYPQAFYPVAPAGLVLEVPAGFAAAHAVALGQKIVVQ